MPRPGAAWSLLLAAVALAGGVGSAAAQVQGPCTAYFNGVEAPRIDSLASPLLLTDDDALVFSGVDAAGTRQARLTVLLGPASLGRAESSAPAAGEFLVSLDLAEVAPYGVGLLRVRALTDNCTVEVWLRLGGRTPFTTLIGLTGGGLALAGLTAQISALLARRRWSLPVAAAAGVATGAGGALLGQEFGRLQLSYPSLAGCIALAVVVGLGLALLLRPRRDRPAAEEGPDRPPTATPAAADPRPSPPVPAPGPASTASLQAPPAAAVAPRPAPAAPPAAAGPFWSYVMAEVEVLDLDDYSRVVAVLRPGAWYLAKREAGGWTRVVAADGVEGWVPRQALHREG
ncbi:MAG: hypothetical protein FJW79_01310 [Actinobacteria bacterium]|nr:hypothetical protein [Actinomycetota bacterium]